MTGSGGTGSQPNSTGRRAAVTIPPASPPPTAPAQQSTPALPSARRSEYQFDRLAQTVSNGNDPQLAGDLQATCEWLSRRRHGAAGKSAAYRLHAAGEHIEVFTPATIYQYVDPAGTAAGIESETGRGLAQWLMIVRNVLILLPLVLTWAGLAYAATLYHAYLDAHKGDINAQNTPFLQLWQDGFGTHDARFSFAHFAIFDLALFGLLIVVGLIVDVWSRQAHSIADQARDRLSAAVRRLTAENLRLTGGVTSTTSPTQWATQVHAVLERASSVVSDVGNRLGTISAQMHSFQTHVNTLASSAQQIGTQAQALTGAVQGIQGSADTLAQSARSLSTSNASLVTAQQSTVQRLQGIDQSISTAAGALAGVQQTLPTTRTAIEGAAVQLRAAASAVQQVGTATNNISQMVTGLQSTMGNVDTTMRNLFTSVQTTAGNTGRAADAITRTLGAFNTELEATQTALGQTTTEMVRTANILRGIDITIRGPLAWFFDRLFHRHRQAVMPPVGQPGALSGGNANIVAPPQGNQTPLPPPAGWPPPTR